MFAVPPPQAPPVTRSLPMLLQSNPRQDTSGWPHWSATPSTTCVATSRRSHAALTPHFRRSAEATKTPATVCVNAPRRLCPVECKTCAERIAVFFYQYVHAVQVISHDVQVRVVRGFSPFISNESFVSLFLMDCRQEKAYRSQNNWRSCVYQAGVRLRSLHRVRTCLQHS